MLLFIFSDISKDGFGDPIENLTASMPPWLLAWLLLLLPDTTDETNPFNGAVSKKICLGNPRTKGQQNGGVELFLGTLAPENKEPPKIGGKFSEKKRSAHRNLDLGITWDVKWGEKIGSNFGTSTCKVPSGKQT